MHKSLSFDSILKRTFSDVSWGTVWEYIFRSLCKVLGDLHRMVYTMYGILGIWLQSLHCLLILNALPVPMLRQVFLRCFVDAEIKYRNCR